VATVPPDKGRGGGVVLGERNAATSVILRGLGIMQKAFRRNVPAILFKLKLIYSVPK